MSEVKNNQNFNKEDFNQEPVSTYKIMFQGAIYTPETYMANFGATSVKNAEECMRILVRKGRASEYTGIKTKAQRTIEQVAKEETFQDAINMLHEEEEQNRQRVRQQKLNQTESLNIALDCDNNLEARNLEKIINEQYGCIDTEISIKNGAYKVRVHNITPEEYTAIAKLYSHKKTVANVTNTMDSVATKATKVVDTTATDIIAPTAKIVGKTAMNVGKSLFHVIAKTGASLINQGAECIKETKEDLTSDREMLEAKATLTRGTDTIRRGVKNTFGGNISNGIHIE